MRQEPSTKVARSVIFDEFLVLEELAALREFSQEREPDFRTSQVFDPGHESDSYRRSRVLLNTGRFHRLMCERITFYLPRILRALNHPFFDVSRVESQITASNDGDYFHMHNDNTHANWPSREITFVYFFHREPRSFQGGELLLYDTREEAGTSTASAIRKRITPEQNSIIFFESSCLHEILPVRCPSRLFADSRFTMNGWLHC
jgi:SM-20-related protein